MIANGSIPAATSTILQQFFWFYFLNDQDAYNQQKILQLQPKGVPSTKSQVINYKNASSPINYEKGLACSNPTTVYKPSLPQ